MEGIDLFNLVYQPKDDELDSQTLVYNLKPLFDRKANSLIRRDRERIELFLRTIAITQAGNSSAIIFVVSPTW